MARKRRPVEKTEPARAAEAANPSSSLPPFWHTLAAVALIVLAVTAAYCNSFDGALIFDDIQSIEENPSIRQLWPLSDVLRPPSGGETVSGRPMLNLSLALNYAVSGIRPWGYHVTNLAIHVLAALLLFGVVRRTLLLPRLREQWAGASTLIAMAVAILWAVHPIQTESVTYVIQRAESLVALFYLLTLYLFVRGTQSTKPVLWYSASVVACLLGMATKEVMLSAPIVVLLYDRAFLTSRLDRSLQRRWGLYLAMALTWLPLTYLVVTTGLLERRNEFGAPSPLAYACTQPGVILHYLRLCIWPDGLCLDYRWRVATTPSEILPGMFLVGALAAATLWGLVRNRPWGFLGACVFLILAPSSSIVPLADLAFEHRMYLPLAALVTFVVVGGYLACEAMVGREWLSRAAMRALGGTLVVVGCIALGVLTYQRNTDYSDVYTIWYDTAQKAPRNPRAHDGVGKALLSEKRNLSEAEGWCRKALEIDPDYYPAICNLAVILSEQGRLDEAIECNRKGIALYRDYPKFHYNLATDLRRLGQLGDAAAEFREVVRISPNDANAYHNLGLVTFRMGDPTEAMNCFQKAVEIVPRYANRIIISV